MSLNTNHSEAKYTPGEIKIAIADDHRLVRDGITKLLSSRGFEVRFEAENGQQIVDYCRENQLDIVLMDINMPIMNGITATAQLRDVSPSTGVIALSMFDDDFSLIRMLKAGAKSYVLKEAPASELEKAILEVSEKGFYYSDFVSSRLITSLGVNREENVEQVLESLSDRELEFLRHACTGLTYKEIADKMCVSPRSVDGYRDNLFVKLNVRSRVELAIFAIKNHIVQI